MGRISGYAMDVDEAMLMITPRPRSTIMRAAHLAPINAPRKLRSRTLSHSRN